MARARKGETIKCNNIHTDYARKHRVDYDMLESGDNAFVNYDVNAVEVSTSSVLCAGNVNCVSDVQISNISNTDITGDNECTIPDVSTVTGMGNCTYHSQCVVCSGMN